MVELAEIQAAYYMVAATGVLVAAVFYALNLRATLQTRQAQLLVTLQKDMNDYEGNLRNRELSYMKWDSYDDFEKKYGSDINPTSYAMRISSWSWYNNLGILLKQKLLDENIVYDSVGSSVIMAWTQWEPIIREQRKRYMGPNLYEHWEHAADRMRAIQVSRGISWKPPDTMIRYVSDVRQ
jgi:hypothetical protein